jgi:hypothetical protein
MCQSKRSLSLQPFHNLHTFTAYLYDLEFIDELASLLARSPNLSELRIDAGPPCGSLSSSPNLSILFAQVNKSNVILPLQRLELREFTVTSDDIRTHLPHLRKLETLTICANTAPGAVTALGEICHVLKNHGVSLRRLSTDYPCDTVLLNFLIVHPGFREIQLKPIYGINNSPEFVDKIFRRILPAQQETLESFRIHRCLHREWRRLPSDSQLDEIAKCHLLRVLHIPYTVSEAEIRQNNTATVVRVFL